MVKKKRMSKRVSTRKRMRLEKRQRELIKKQRKATERVKSRIPPSVFRTDEEKYILTQIEEKQQLRNDLDVDIHSNIDDQYDSVFLESLLAKSDCVLYFLDSRDPFGSYSEEILKKIESAGCKYVFVLSRIETVPEDVVNDFLTSISQRGPCLIYGESFNIENFIKYLNEYIRKNEAIVGLIGQRNLGRHRFLIQLRKFFNQNQSETLNTFFDHGVTTYRQSYKNIEDYNIFDTTKQVFNSDQVRNAHNEDQILDKPQKAGEIFANEILRSKISHEMFFAAPFHFLSVPATLLSDSSYSSVLRGAFPLEKVNTMNLFKALENLCGLPQLCIFYDIFTSDDNFLDALANKLGLSSRRSSDRQLAARRVILDVVNSKLRFFTTSKGDHRIVV